MTSRGLATLGGVFDRAVTLTVRHWHIVLPLGLIEVVPSLGTRRDPSLYGATAWWALDVAVLALTATAWISAFSEDAGRNTLESVFRRALPIYPRALGAMFVSMLLVLAALMIAVGAVAVAFMLGRNAGGVAAGSIVAALVAVPAALFAMPVAFACNLAFTVCILERLSIFAAVGASLRRAFRDGLLRPAVFGLALIAMSAIPDLSADGLTQLLGATALSRWIEVLASLVTSLVISPYSIALMVVAALDYRNRYEGADLAAALEACSAR